MGQGELELQAATLPNDLAQYVVVDNEAFQKEIVKCRHQWGDQSAAISVGKILQIKAVSTALLQINIFKFEMFYRFSPTFFFQNFFFF